MGTRIRLETTYLPSEDIVAREIDGELIIVPLTSGIGEYNDELYTLNETGIAIWHKLDGCRTVREIVEELSGEYEPGGGNDISTDVSGILGELLKRKIIAKKKV